MGRALDRLREAQQRVVDESEEWRNAQSGSEMIAWLTADELGEMNDAITAVLDRHIERLTDPRSATARVRGCASSWRGVCRRTSRGSTRHEEAVRAARVPAPLRRAEHVDARRLGDAAGAEHVGEDAHRLQRDGRASPSSSWCCRRSAPRCSASGSTGCRASRSWSGATSPARPPCCPLVLVRDEGDVWLIWVVAFLYGVSFVVLPGRGQRAAQGAAPRGPPGRRQLQPGHVQGGVPAVRAVGRAPRSSRPRAAGWWPSWTPRRFVVAAAFIATITVTETARAAADPGSGTRWWPGCGSWSATGCSATCSSGSAPRSS